ncbi:hypothetical protein ILYODFUR_006082 [Ilyodon furcidens]|uniref:Uncharacterized protein n=1 Tax=Ilyodon furcidens TaxID=33524 RepID=A0ABV0UHV1_9TELE
MAYGLPHREEKVQFPYEDTADVSANGHASRHSVTVPHQKYPDYFSSVDVFRNVFFFLFVFFTCVQKVEQKWPLANEEKGTINLTLCKMFEQTQREDPHASLLHCKRSSERKL